MRSQPASPPAIRAARPRVRRHGYTLVEMLLVVLLLGIAAMMVIPNIDGANSLRVQAVVRSIVADITVTQSDALARQSSRAIVFDVAANAYEIYEVNGPALDPADLMQRVQLRATGSAGLVGSIVAASFNGTNTLVFDELGGPVRGLTNNQPADRGTVRVAGSGQTFDIHVEAYTGQVRVERVTP